MKFNTTEFKNNQLIIKGRKSPFAIRATLTVVLLICILIPIIVATSLMSERKGPHIGLFLGFFFLWGLGFYLLRIILWNTYGREVLTFESDKIIYEADYGFFKDGKTIISTTNIELTAIPYANEKIKTKRVKKLNITNGLAEVKACFVNPTAKFHSGGPTGRT